MTTWMSASGAHFGVRPAAEASLDAYVPFEVSESMIAGAMTVDLHELGYFGMPSNIIEVSGRGR